MTALRERLRSELGSKVERYGVVVWDDPEAAYGSVIADVAPADALVHAYSGSWFELRHQIEAALAGTHAPRLIVYLPAKAPEPDPLEELRAVGQQFRLKLPTLIKGAYTGQFTEQRLMELGQQCATIADAEAAVEGGGSSSDARLVALCGDGSAPGIAAAVISGAFDTELEARGLEAAARAAVAEAVGGDFGAAVGVEFREAAFRQVVLVALSSTLGALPSDLAGSVSAPSNSQRKFCDAVVTRLRSQYPAEFARLAAKTDGDLHLAVSVPWSESLVHFDLTPAFDSIAATEAYRLLGADHYALAERLAAGRLSSSWWLSTAAPSDASPLVPWRAIRALAHLGAALEEPLPSPGSLAEVRDWYVGVGWRVDSAYRHSELARVTAGDALDALDDMYQRVRQRYEKWLDDVLHRTSSALAVPEVVPADLQRAIHETRVRKSTGLTAYVLVDALRFELGADLAARLRIVSQKVDVASAIGAVPTITPIGMAAVLPGADTSFSVDLDDAGRLAVSIGGVPVRDVKTRVGRLEHAHGRVADIVLDDVAQSSNKELRRKISGAALVLVRSTEIDADGESDQLAASWGSFDTILNVLQTAVAKLLHNGVERVVITSDHGFLAVRQLGEERRIDRPATGTGEQHRRAWIGRGGTASPSTTKIPLSAFGIGGDLDIISPKGLGVFTSGGGLQFFHGGLSPQELIVPVITVLADQQTFDPKYSIKMRVAGDTITTGMVAVAIEMSGDLFTSESRVRLQLTQGQERVGLVVGGDGYEASTETIGASVANPKIISMQIVRNLAAGSTATLEVIDAATGVRLDTQEVRVAANIVVDDLD